MNNISTLSEVQNVSPSFRIDGDGVTRFASKCQTSHSKHWVLLAFISLLLTNVSHGFEIDPEAPTQVFSDKFTYTLQSFKDLKSGEFTIPQELVSWIA
jgi:hypothetical protein